MLNHASTIKIRNTIKTQLKKHGYTYSDLANSVRLSEGAIKQLMTKGVFTTERLETIAQVFGLTLFELLEIAGKSERKPFPLNSNQELVLSKNPLALRILLLLSTGFNLEEVERRVSPRFRKDVAKTLYSLDRIGLIELKPGNKFKLKARGPFRFIKDGVLNKSFRSHYLELISKQITNTPNQDTMQNSFELYCSAQLLKQMKQELDQLISRYATFSALDTELYRAEQIFPVTGFFLLKPFDGWGQILEDKA